jgi:hypothetical protein
MNIEQALKLFALNAASIDEEKLMAAFRAAAKRFHPDSYQNFKAKVASAESLNAAIEARNVLRQALASRQLPRLETTFERDRGEPTSGRIRRANPFIRDARGFYDSVSLPPFQRAMEHPILGAILAVPASLSIIVAMMAGTLASFPILIVGAVLMGLIGERRRGWLRNKAQSLSGYATGLVVFPVYFALSAAGVFIWADGRPDYVFPLGVGIVWFGLTFMALDEIYSLVRYHLFLKKRASRALATLQAD